MALFSSILFIVVFSIVNGEYLEFWKGHCPDFTTLEDISVKQMSGVFFTLAETDNGTSRTDVVNRMTPLPDDEFVSFERFINPSFDSDDGCIQLKTGLKKIAKGRFLVTYLEEVPKVDEQNEIIDGYTINFLSSSVMFICQNKHDHNGFDAKLTVQSRENDGFGPALQKEVADLLKSKNLTFMFDYLKPVSQNNNCPIIDA